MLFVHVGKLDTELLPFPSVVPPPEPVRLPPEYDRSACQDQFSKLIGTPIELDPGGTKNKYVSNVS